MVIIFVPAVMKKNKNNWILLLMIASQALLILFVFHWLRLQYIAEKDRLTGELAEIYIEARDEMVDTLLFRNYVRPVLADREDSVFKSSGQLKGIVRLMDNERRVIVNMEHSPDSSFTPSEALKIGKKDMLLRSVRLIISHTGDTLSKDEPLTRDFGIIPDTAAFKVHFHRRLLDSGMKFNLIWVRDSSINHKFKRTLYLAPLNPFSLPAVKIKDYNGYIAVRIVPQVLFGVLLIFLTGMAFMLSYRSLRDHAIMNKLRNEFVSNMTHELKTPVASISLALESLSKYKLMNDPLVMKEYLELAISETKRLEELINRVLDNSILEGDNHKVNFNDTDINSIMRSVISVMQTRLTNGEIKFIPSEDQLILKCDELLLKGVIFNILDNSIKYCNTNPEIIVTSEIENGYANIVVTDNGPGIPDEYREKIFEKFFRIPSGNVHNVKGYGLGLNFVSVVLKIHYGKISVTNLERGCSFKIMLPLQ